MLPSDLVNYKKKSRKIIALTAWDSISGSIAEQANVDLVLVGDSLAMVCLGYKSTLPLTLEDMTSASEIIYDVVDQEANIIVGAVVDEAMEGEIQVTVIATGFETTQPLNQQRIKNRLSNQPLYNFSDNKESGASIPEFLRLRQNKKDIG